VNRVLPMAACVTALFLGACSGGSFMFGSAAPPAPAAAPAPAAPALPTGAALGGILGGPVGAGLDEADRQAAYDAQAAALEAGQRRTWRGEHGAFGYVEPGPGTDSAQGFCRTYSQTIYLGGRAQRGRGLGCRQPDGSWRMAS
jgi:surface antigen